MLLSDQSIASLEKKGYRFVGSKKHAAAKVCHWTKKSIMDDGVCYKEKFYGIESHRCLRHPVYPSATINVYSAGGIFL